MTPSVAALVGELRAMLVAATPGPWKVVRGARQDRKGQKYGLEVAANVSIADRRAWEEGGYIPLAEVWHPANPIRAEEPHRAEIEASRDANAALMAATRNALPALLDALEAGEARFTAPIVVMCGSTRFRSTWVAELARLTDEGNIVLSVGRMMPQREVDLNPALKERLDHLHKRKIDLADWVWVLDVGGYIGASTKSEITYAESLGRPIRYLSREFPDFAEPLDALMEACRGRDAALALAGRLRDGLLDVLDTTIAPFADSRAHVVAHEDCLRIASALLADPAVAALPAGKVKT